MTKVVVLGLGYIGLPTAAMLALHGSRVLGVDIQPQVLEALKAGNVPVREKDLTALVRDALRHGRLELSDQPKAADYFVICVPTPQKDRRADLTFVRRAARALTPLIQEDSTVIVESTVPPGTTMNFVRPILETGGLRAGVDFHLAYCPERVMPGNIVHEIAQNDRTIGGIVPASAERAKELYATFVRGSIHLTDLSTAEFVKLAENAFRDVNIALSNELADLAEAHGVNVWEAIDLANKHPRVKLLRPGPGVGGHCIAVDPWFLLHPSAKARMIPAARTVNDHRPRQVVERIAPLLRDVRRPKVAALGVAYKGNADDVRESPAIKIVDQLRAARVRVDAYDPLVPHDLYSTSPLEETVDGADLVLVLTDHTEFRYIDPILVSEKVRRRVLFDARNCVDHSKWARAGFDVYILGYRLPDRGTNASSGDRKAAESLVRLAVKAKTAKSIEVIER